MSHLARTPYDYVEIDAIFQKTIRNYYQTDYEAHRKSRHKEVVSLSKPHKEYFTNLMTLHAIKHSDWNMWMEIIEQEDEEFEIRMGLPDQGDEEPIGMFRCFKHLLNLFF